MNKLDNIDIELELQNQLDHYLLSETIGGIIKYDVERCIEDSIYNYIPMRRGSMATAVKGYVK